MGVVFCNQPVLVSYSVHVYYYEMDCAIRE